MSPQPFAHSPDLKKLREEGYCVEVRDNLLIMREVPYLNASGEVLQGTLISPLQLAGDKALPPDNHQVFFVGEAPYHQNGSPLNLGGSLGSYPVGAGFVAQFHYSIKPQKEQRYEDYHHKMTTYAGLLSAPAQAVDPDATPRINRPLEEEEEEDSVFEYPENASGRVGIGGLTALLKNERVGIVGVGGTGSYILDFLAKTPVREIRLIDGDDFLNHNAFRAPGAASLAELQERPKKVDYLLSKYANMRRGIVAHAVALNESNLELLDGLTFVFLCMDGGKAKTAAIARMEEMGISFIEVGMSINLAETGLGGMVRVTASTPDNRDTLRGKVSGADDGDNLYSTNIQIAELNALNAVGAVVKWKQLMLFYRDFEKKHHITYTTDTDQWEGKS